MNPNENQVNSGQPQGYQPPLPSTWQTPANQSDPVQKANQAKANLGFINTMQQHLLEYKSGGKKAPQSPNSAPGQENGQETTNEPKDENKPDLAKELSSFKIEIEGMIKSQIGDLKREIQSAMESEEPTKDNEQTETQTNP